MQRAGTQFIILALYLCANSGCGTLANLKGEEPWLIGFAPQRPVAPFGGIDNDLRWMKRGIRSDGWESGPIVAATIDMPLSFAGDIITLPWTTYQSLRPARTTVKSHFDNQAMREEVLKHLSIGMPIETAKRIMEDSGFKCENITLLSGPSCVRCLAVFRTHHLFISDEIQILLYNGGGKLSSIEVDCRSISP
jgi:hypothetical protein